MAYGNALPGAFMNPLEFPEKNCTLSLWIEVFMGEGTEAIPYAMKHFARYLHIRGDYDFYLYRMYIGN